MKPFPTTNRTKFRRFMASGFSWSRLIAVDGSWVEWELRYGPHSYRVAVHSRRCAEEPRVYAARHLRLVRNHLRTE